MKSSSDTRAPYDASPRIDSLRSMDTDDRKYPTSVEGPAQAPRKDMAVGIYREDAAATMAARYQSRSLSAISGAVASSSDLTAMDLHTSTAVSGTAPSADIPSDGETAHGHEPFRKDAIWLPSGPSPATGPAAVGARWEQGQSSAGRAVAHEPDVLMRDPLLIARDAATGEVAPPAPQGDGLIAHLPQTGRAVFERAFNHWFARIVDHGDAIEGANATNPTRLMPLSLAAAVVIAGIGLVRLVRRGGRGQSAGARGEGRRGSILDFPVDWSPRIS